MKTRETHLLKILFAVCMTMTLAPLLEAQDVVTAVEGSIKRIDSATKVVVVATADGTEHTFHFAGDLAVHGGKDTGKGVRDGLHGIGVGSRVAVHYTIKSGRETAHEIDKLGDGGLKVTKGTSAHIDRATKKLFVKTEDGSVKTFDLADHAAEEAAKDIVSGGDKTAKVTVYYTENVTKKTAHFIARGF